MSATPRHPTELLPRATLRVRMGAHDAHYGGNLVDGARMLALFGDVATELLIRCDGDEGLFRAYDSVEFLAPVRAGDYIEVVGEIVKMGATSRTMRFEARKVISARGDLGPSAADALAEPVVVCRASGTCVTPKAEQRLAGRPPLIVTAAIVGAETTRAQNPHLPHTAAELGAEAARCLAAGASIVHLHAREDDGRPSQSRALFRAAIAEIRKLAPGLIVQTSTGGAVGMSIDERTQPLTLDGDVRPEMATLNVGSINFGDDVFVNAPRDVVEVARRIRAAGIMPELEIYDLGHLDIVRALLKAGEIAPPLHLQFVLGVRGALAASEANLGALVAATRDLPASTTWAVAGVGRHQLALAECAARWGGHARVGLEDNIYLDKGVLAEGSAPLVARIVAAAGTVGRKVATPAEARALLGLTVEPGA